MTVFVSALVMVLFTNAVVSFFIAFFWQAKVILTIFSVSDWQNANSPWTSLGNQNSPQNTFGRFVAGEIFPELRRPWLRAVSYASISFVALFLVAGLVQLIAPEYLM